MLKVGLYIISTPIGNLGDITFRASKTLNEVDVIACEDTRVSKKLLSLLGILENQIFIPCHEHNIDDASNKIIDFINNGKSVALISDAGSPIISDPGALLIKKMIDSELFYTALPGATAFVPALQMSGVMAERFMFCGFLPSKSSQRIKYLDQIKDYDSAFIFYESPHRIIDSLKDLKKVLEFRTCAVVREITKIYEEVVCDSFDKVIEFFENKSSIKGEFVIVISKKEKQEIEINDEIITETLMKKMKKMSLKDAVKEVMVELSLSKKIVYKKALEINDK